MLRVGCSCGSRCRLVGKCLLQADALVLLLVLVLLLPPVVQLPVSLGVAHHAGGCRMVLFLAALWREMLVDVLNVLLRVGGSPPVSACGGCS